MYSLWILLGNIPGLAKGKETQPERPTPRPCPTYRAVGSIAFVTLAPFIQLYGRYLKQLFFFFFFSFYFLPDSSWCEFGYGVFLQVGFFLSYMKCDICWQLGDNSLTGRVFLRGRGIKFGDHETFNKFALVSLRSLCWTNFIKSS